MEDKISRKKAFLSESAISDSAVLGGSASARNNGGGQAIKKDTAGNNSNTKRTNTRRSKNKNIATQSTKTEGVNVDNTVAQEAKTTQSAKTAQGARTAQSAKTESSKGKNLTVQNSEAEITKSKKAEPKYIPFEIDPSVAVRVKGGMGYEFAKRAFDIISSGMALIVFGWLILLLMFIKFCEDGHNPIYTSTRVGKMGKLIKFHKIRSMVPNAEQMKDTLIAQGKNHANGPVFKAKDDERITKFGKFLRKASLDELPQLWDIFVGRISVIGPRSPLISEVEKYTEYQKNRLAVKGGLICTWQITPNRHDLLFDDWIKLDIDYIENRSILLDLKILFKAVKFILTDRTGE